MAVTDLEKAGALKTTDKSQAITLYNKLGMLPIKYNTIHIYL